MKHAEVRSADDGPRHARLRGAPPALLVLAIPFAITAAAGAVSVFLARLYLARTTYYYDSAQYRLVAARVHRTLELRGRASALVEAARLKDGLDVVLRVLFCPQLLLSRFGHLAVALPFLFLFLSLVTIYVLRRTRSLALATLAASMVWTAGVVTGPYAGLADYWKDSIGCWLLGSAVLAWLLSDRLRRAGWSALAGLCLGLLLLQRTAAAVFAAPGFALLCLHAGIGRLRADGWKRASRELAAFVAPALGLLVFLVALQLESLRAYYTGFGYSYGGAGLVTLALGSTLRWLGGVFVVAGPIALILCLREGRWREDTTDLFTALFLAAAFTGTILLARGVYVPGYAACATVLGLVLVAASMPRELAPARRRRLVLTLALLVGAGSLAELGLGVRRALRLETMREAHTPGPLEAAQLARTFQTRLARLLLAQPPPRVFKLIYTETDAEFWNFAVFEVDQEKGASLEESDAFFSVHDSYYRATFGKTAPADEIVTQDLARLEQTPGTTVVATCVPADVLRQVWFTPDPKMPFMDGNPLAGQVAVRLNERISDSPRWRRLAVLDSPWGCVAAFRFER